MVFVQKKSDVPIFPTSVVRFDSLNAVIKMYHHCLHCAFKSLIRGKKKVCSPSYKRLGFWFFFFNRRQCLIYKGEEQNLILLWSVVYVLVLVLSFRKKVSNFSRRYKFSPMISFGSVFYHLSFLDDKTKITNVKTKNNTYRWSLLHFV